MQTLHSGLQLTLKLIKRKRPLKTPTGGSLENFETSLDNAFQAFRKMPRRRLAAFGGECAFYDHILQVYQTFAPQPQHQF